MGSERFQYGQQHRFSTPSSTCVSLLLAGASSSAKEPQTTANAWLLLSMRQALDLSGDGLLSFEEFSQNKTSVNLSAEDQDKLVQIDQAAFKAIQQADGVHDGVVDLGVLAGNKYLLDQVGLYGNPLPSDYVLGALVAKGTIADPNALTEADSAALEALQKNFAESGFEALSPEDQNLVRRAVANMLTVEEGEGTQAAAPIEEQLSAGINTLRQRTRYERNLEPVPGVEQKHYDFQSLLGGGPQTDRYNVGPAKSKPTHRRPKAKAQNSVLSWAFIVSSRRNMSPMRAL